MGKYILQRIAYSLFVIFITSLLIFFVLDLLPGDRAAFVAGIDSSEESIEAIRESLGLSRPVYIQFFDWFTGALKLDFGTSLIYNKPVKDLIFDALPITLSLTLFSCFITILLTVILASLASYHKFKVVDGIIRFVTEILSSIPSFLIGIFLMLVFAFRLKLFPIKGYVSLSENFFKHINSIFLPSLALSVSELAFMVRLLRLSMINELDENYVITAECRRVPSYKIFFNYVLRGSMLSPLTMLGIQLSKLIGGSIIIENLFSLPGLGRLLLIAVEQRDIILLEGISLFILSSVIIISMLIDLLTFKLNPELMKNIS